ncbi:mandelate racemase/muconate lactonizing enzyme family protein [Magnetospirillum molischianum]|uniref:Putative o-succinylbenzoate synthase n=1 Tax=Magnetospirillum molischianum DSM 120 TaxID=1150626 RepID=H8FXS3_MAGML|nr:enolase C-terminal domain-like protein [Magnetospirillum molischianum]CCG43161.1 putative o-succinylbenzoate synthase [Magnetospirillum molischianum DSM 120]
MSRIAGFRIDPYALALTRPWRTAAGTVRLRHGWLVRVEDEDGCFGLGDEPASLPDQVTEGQGARLESLAAATLGQSPDVALTESLGYGIGIETALLDLIARRRGQSLRHLLAPEAADFVNVNGIGPIESVVAIAEQGFRIVKIKVGLAPWRDEAAALCRLSLPPGLMLRLDSNRAWSFREAEGFLSAVSGLPIDSLEEPLRAPDIDQLAMLQARTEISLAIDESLESLGISSLLARRPVRRLVLKPALLGGLRWTQSLAAKARDAGYDIVVTSFLDSAVGVAAAAHLAAAVDAESRMAHGLATSDAFADDVAKPLRIVAGKLSFNEDAGLGML